MLTIEHIEAIAFKNSVVLHMRFNTKASHSSKNLFLYVIKSTKHMYEINSKTSVYI